MSDEYKLLDSYNKLLSDKTTERTSGLSDLRQILSNRTNTKGLNDKGYHKLYEALFRATIKEKSIYTRPQKESLKKTTATRLSTCGQVFRQAVELGVKKIKAKTFRAVYKHIIDTLPLAGEGLCEPISLDYAKALRVCLQHAPHAEHIPSDEWESLVAFCCTSVEFQLGLIPPDEDEEDIQAEEGRTLSREASSASRRSLPVSQSAMRRLRHDSEELIHCLHLLLAATNAPIKDHASMVCNTLLGFLASQTNVTRAHQAVFSALNIMLNAIGTNNLVLSARVSEEIMPILSRLWDTKSPSLKEEMIISLMLCQPHIQSQLRDPKARGLRRRLQDLFDILFTDYVGRTEKDILQLEDIVFPDSLEPASEEQLPLAIRAFSLRKPLYNMRSEQNWMIPGLMANIIQVLDKDNAINPTQDDEARVKRQKTSSHFSELMQSLRAPHLLRKICALQVMCFLASTDYLDQSQFLSIILTLYDACSDDNSTVSSWAMLSISSCAFSCSASHSAHSSFWQQCWQLCSRYQSSQPTCRAACHLLRIIMSRNLVTYSSISRTVDSTILSIDLSGPAGIFDSSLSAWRVMLRRRSTVPHSTNFHHGERLFKWFISKWHPEDSLEKSGASFHSYNSPPLEVVNFLFACSGMPPMETDYYSYQTYGSIGQAKIRTSKSSELVKFLLQLDEKDETQEDTTMRLADFEESRSSGLDRQVIDFLDKQAGLIHEKWQELVTSQMQHITTDMVHNLTGFLCIASILCSALKTQDPSRAATLESKLLGTLLPAFLSYLARDDCSQKHIDGLLRCLGDLLPKPAHLLDHSSLSSRIFQGVAGNMLCRISVALARKENASSVTDDAEDANDLMDLDDGFGMLETNRNDEDQSKGWPRESVQALCSNETFRSCAVSHLSLFTISMKHENIAELCTGFTVYLMGFDAGRLISARPIIRDFFTASSSIIKDDDIADFIEHLAIQQLQSYETERCETSIGLCIDVIAALTNRWVSNDLVSDAVGACEAVYDHLVKIVLDKHVTSYTLRTSMACLLEQMLWSNSDYQKAKPKSPRSLFISMIRNDDVRVIFHTAQRIPVLFKIFGIAVHQKVFVEIEDNLARDGTWTEGLAMRVYTLAQLARNIFSSISRMVYRIFETGQVESGQNFAARSLLVVAKALGVASQRDLFRLFSPALLYAWLENHDLRSFPFRVFNYATLTELCGDVSDELVAQLIARGQDDVAEYVASLLHITFNELVEKAFAKVVAYGVAWAVGTPPTSSTPSADVRVKKRIGNEIYSQLLRESYPLIIAHLFQLMQEEGTSERLLSKDSNLADAYDVMKDIMELGVSEQRLGDPQRPYFKVKVILNGIHHVCSRLGYEDAHIWSPAMFTVVVRRLFDSMHPARGPLHACAVIRNIRLVICLAGLTSYEGYPLEMVMHGLVPYIADNICAEDAIGIMRHLLMRGEPYLAKHPAFLISLFLSIAASLQAYLNTKSNNDNQDVQVRISISSINRFHNWLTDHLSNLDLRELGRQKRQTFQAIVQCAASLREHDGSARQAVETSLLRTLLDDEQSVDPLLDRVSQPLAFTLLCFSFKRPESYRTDLFGDDTEAIERSRSLLRLCRRLPVSNNFLLWSARVLGRSYAASGQLYAEWTHEIEFTHPTDVISDEQPITIIPKLGILRKIKGLLLSQQKEVVALAESTLTYIIHDENAAAQDENVECRTIPFIFEEQQYKALQWELLPASSHKEPTTRSAELPGNPNDTACSPWVRSVARFITAKIDGDPLMRNLRPLLDTVDGLAEELFPYILHLLLLGDQEDPSRGLRGELSKLFSECFRACSEQNAQHNMILIKSILYLRSQKVHNETTQLARDGWLDINYLDLSRAACICKMYKSALLFAEIYGSESSDEPILSDLLLEIFRNVDDPDSYYGVSQTSNLETVLKQFEYEGDGWKSLSFRGANLESDIRLGSRSEEEDTGVIDALNTLGMNGLSHSFLRSGTVSTTSASALDNMFRSAWKLEQWDLPCPTSCTSRSATIYRALQTVNNTVDSRSIPSHLDTPLLDIMQQISASKQTGHSLGEGMRTLALMTEMEEVLVSADAAQLEVAWNRLQARTSWMHIGKYSDVEEIMAMRQATFGSLAKQEHLQGSCRVDTKTARFMEAKALVSCCKMARSHGILQHALSAATQLSKVVRPCMDVGLDINAVATLQAANVLWAQGQRVTSIRMLQTLEGDPDDLSQSMIVGRAKLLAKLGNWISEARLERADKIMSNYLEKAIVELHSKSKGSEAGRVFHEFAYFCDQQLQNPGNIEDYQRALKLRQSKDAEVREFEKLLKATPNSKDNNQLTVHRNKAKTWLKLDDAEFNRLKESREAFLEKSVSNYLRCLSACDDYDGDAVRFCALWLANSGDRKVNSAATELANVPSRKFVPFMNQLSSRLLESSDEFQKLLFALIVRMCTDHPHHGIYQILALHRLRPKDKDYVTASRRNAATRVTEILKTNTRVKKLFINIRFATNAYIKLASYKIEKKGNKPVPIKTALSRELAGYFERGIPDLMIPPPTMHIEIRADCDYETLPRLYQFYPEVTLASGLSAPKIIKCQASDGKIFKLLVKGGNDDLRQDAIMEQVFEQVSTLLQKSRATRQRDLRIRTYKVLPLTTSTGVIEFVPNTIPLHDYLMPAHAHYHPKDWKNTACRKAIQDVQTKDRDTRIAVFQRVMEHFSPVLRYFFMHRFNGPDEWFASRLAYTRSTAAISILGHVLGLGDRHGHNILLDEKSGEVIHIDLGVAFEQGRILPVPEVVPFRLTRDIVDGMGITKTEGVFRRCCEFTLEVLRNESYSIVTILDVLRYDPLYSWTISPLRVKKMQENQYDAQPSESSEGLGDGNNPRDESESEADRALTVVAKKLSKTLSVGATVNELIQQASDERNLAVLYSGWAAFV